MIELEKVYSFNTGRQYSKFCQPIDWMITKSHDHSFGINYVVFFVDRARNIYGSIPCLISNLELINNDWVLNQYDHYQYYSNGMALKQIDYKLKEQKNDS